MAIRKELLAGREPSEVFGADGLLDELKRGLAERTLNAELGHHLATERAEADGDTLRNHRNGHSRKTVLTGTGKLELAVPRDRQASFEPQLIAKYRRRFSEFDDKVVSLYARGLSVREIQGHLRELYGIDVSPDLVSTVTDAVLEQVGEWQNRPLDPVYALVFFDALRVKIRDEGTVRNKAVYLALGVRPDGTKEVLGLWIEQTEGAKFWLRVMNELRHRGVTDVLIAVVDGLRGLSRGDQCSVPGHSGADLHYSSDPPFAGVRVLERTPRGRGRPEAGLPGRQRRSGPRGPGRLRRRALGQALPSHRAGLAAAMGAGHPVLRLPPGGQAHGLHHQRHREPEQLPAQGCPAPRALPHR